LNRNKYESITIWIHEISRSCLDRIVAFPFKYKLYRELMDFSKFAFKIEDKHINLKMEVPLFSYIKNE